MTLGIGIVGCGNISTTYFRLVPIFHGMEVRACADLNMDLARQRAEEYAVAARTPEDLIASDDIDVIVNLTVPDAHYAITRDALAAGKHVYSEKPLALTLEDGKSLADLAAEVDRRVGCAPDTFMGGAHQHARGVLDEGTLGNIVAGTCHVMGHGMEHWHPNPDFFFLPGGGPILDIGPYYVANLINLIGPARRVAALTSAASSTRTIGNGPRDGEVIPVKTPTNIHALVEFQNGATVTISASWDVWAHEHANMELYGEKGSLFVPDPNFFGGDVRIAGEDGEIKPLPPTEHPCAVPNDQHDRGMLANYRGVGLADMVAAIAEGRDHRCSLDRALHALDVMLSILKSGETGAFVDLTTICTRPDHFGEAEAAALLRETA